MKQISISIPDKAAEILQAMADYSGQSQSSLASGLLSSAIYLEASMMFKGMNFLNSVAKFKTLEKGGQKNE